MSEKMTPRDLAARMLGAAQAQALGLHVPEVDVGRGVMVAPWREELVGDPDTGVIASGVVTTLIDHVCGMAVSSMYDEPTGTSTLDLRIDYMRPAAPRSAVTAEARCYKLTRTIGFVRAQAWDADPSDLVATAQAVFFTTGVAVSK